MRGVLRAGDQFQVDFHSDLFGGNLQLLQQLADGGWFRQSLIVAVDRNLHCVRPRIGTAGSELSAFALVPSELCWERLDQRPLPMMYPILQGVFAIGNGEQRECRPMQLSARR